MKLSRRTVLKGTAASFATLAAPHIARAVDPVKLGSIHDISGIFDLYGRPMQRAVEIAVDEINAAGGVAGRPIEIVTYDTQSDIALYTQFAQRLGRQDRVDVVHGGILSASREAIRPTLRRTNTLYFYNTQYEGGVCDRNVFCTGVTPSQQTEHLIPYATQKWGTKLYTLAADYNYGQITAKWVQFYAERAGAEVVQTDFFPLDVTDFGSTIAKIQDAAPDIIVSALVGGNHLSFYRQWAAAGMNERIPMISTTFGVGNEQKVLTAEEGNGMLLSYSYSKQLEIEENQSFLSRWEDRFETVDDIHELAVATYQGVKLWAEGVNVAGTPERMPVIEALEGGIGMTGPTGAISVEPQTHHLVTNVHILEVQDQKLNIIESFDQVEPADTMQVCNLQDNPDDTTQYEINI